MRKSTKRVLGGLALAAGAVGAAGAYVGRKKKMKSKPRRTAGNSASVWARPGMTVTFRGELMPGRDREVTFVFTILVVDDDHETTRSEIFDRRFYAG